MGEVRIKVVAGVMFLAFAGLMARAFDLQALRSDEFEKELLVKKSTTLVVRAMRGTIRDRNGKVLARDDRAFDLYVELDDFEKNEQALPALCALLKVSTEEISEALEKLYADINRIADRADPKMRARVVKGEKRYARLLRRGISQEAAFDIELHEDRYDGLVVRETLKRVYPYGATAAHVIGYVGMVNGDEYRRLMDEEYFFPNLEDHVGASGVARMKRQGEFMQEMLGRMGVEKSFDRVLRGRSGLSIVERNTETRARSVIDLVPAENGEDLILSIDIELQKHVEETLAASAFAHEAAVVVDVATGGILALASKPSFDPNAFVPPINGPLLREYFEDKENLPLMNRAIGGTYQLGSIFKAVSAYAGLENGIINVHSEIECRGKAFENRNDAFRCWLYRQDGRTHGRIPLSEALEQSCNCFFFELGKKLSLQQVEAAAERFGFGKPTGLGLPGERKGALPSHYKPARWTMPDTMSLCIGQSSLMVTPAQVAQMMTIIANDGRSVPITITGSSASNNNVADPKLVDGLMEGMKRCVNGPHGTAREPALQKVFAAGKTSSAQTVIGKEAHAWFAGYAPADKPRYAFVVLVEHGTSGGHAAAPLAGKILEKLFSQ